MEIVVDSRVQYTLCVVVLDSYFQYLPADSTSVQKLHCFCMRAAKTIKENTIPFATIHDIRAMVDFIVQKALEDVYASILAEPNLTTTDIALKTMLVCSASDSWDMLDAYSFRMLDGINKRISDGKGRHDCSDDEAFCVLQLLATRTADQLES